MIYEYKGVKPRLGDNVFLAPGVVVLGDVRIGDRSSLWFYTVARGDVNTIEIGREANIQDHCMLHVTRDQFPLKIGDGVVVGHRAVLHGCTIHDNALIGMGSIVLDGSVVEEGAIVAAGALVSPGSIIPANHVAVGIPARAVREVSEQERVNHQQRVSRYQEYGRLFHELVRPL
jgi:carbonic anhydrase/acetyltransferase-like protein (isoleucine patch superfamily)